jgi:outer membrane protein TolC
MNLSVELLRPAVCRRALRLYLVAWIVTVLTLGAASAGWAQEAAQPSPQPSLTGQQGPASTPPSSVLRLSRDEAIRLATENNPDLKVVQFEPLVNDARVAAARGVFLPTATSSVLRNSDTAPSTNLFSGDTSLKTRFWSGSAGLNQLLPWGGGSYDVSFTSARTTSNSPITTFTPSLSSTLQAIISQPLLRNFKTDNARAQLEITRRNRDIADVQVREQGAQVLADAEAAYWALVSATTAVGVQQRSLDLALELERTNRARVDVGQSPPLDLVSARAEVAQRRENLIVARTQALQAEDQLRTLVLDPSRADYWSVRLEPTDRVPPIGIQPDVDAAVRRALSSRGDLVESRRQIENIETNVALARNDTLPDLRAQATYVTTGQGGTRLIRTGGFPGTIAGVDQTSFGNVLGQVFSSDFPNWTVGFTLSYPVGRSVEEANLARTRIERDQARARIRSLELSVVREVRDAALRLEQNRQRIETARLGRELAEQRLDAEQKRFEVGMSTSFLVIQAQRDLAVALDNEQRSYLDYQLAVVTFERVQQVGQSDRVRASGTQSFTSSQLPTVQQVGQGLRATQVVGQ